LCSSGSENAKTSTYFSGIGTAVPKVPPECWVPLPCLQQLRNEICLASKPHGFDASTPGSRDAGGSWLVRNGFSCIASSPGGRRNLKLILQTLNQIQIPQHSGVAKHVGLAIGTNHDVAETRQTRWVGWFKNLPVLLLTPERIEPVDSG